VKKVKRGCPQGSVLGPILFNLYVRKSMETLPPEVDYYSYADDSYVVVHENNEQRMVEKLEQVIVKHIEQLTSVGMIVNSSKTEIIQFMPRTGNMVKTVKVCGESVTVVDKIKVLGLTFDSKLTWKPHIDNVKKKITMASNGIKLIRRKLEIKQALTVVTAQALSILYYGSVVWLTPGLRKTQLKALESMHYRCLRLVIRDFRRKVSRHIIDKITKRLPPTTWMDYSICSLYINAKMTGQPSGMIMEIESNLYTKRRHEGRLFGFDNSRSKSSRQRTRNWLGQSLARITTPWTDLSMSKDQIRILLKRNLYPSDW